MKLERWFVLRCVVLVAIFGMHLALPVHEKEPWDPVECVVLFFAALIAFSCLAYFASRRRPTRSELWHSSFRADGIGAYLFVHLFSWVVAAATAGLLISQFLLGRFAPSAITTDGFVFVALRLSLMISGTLLRLRERNRTD